MDIVVFASFYIHIDDYGSSKKKNHSIERKKERKEGIFFYF